MRIKNMYMNFMKDYHFNKATKALNKASEHLDDEKSIVWMKLYKKHVNRFCDIVNSKL